MPGATNPDAGRREEEERCVAALSRGRRIAARIAGFILPLALAGILWALSTTVDKPLFPPLWWLAAGALGSLLFGNRLGRSFMVSERYAKEWARDEEKISYRISEQLTGAAMILLIGGMSGAIYVVSGHAFRPAVMIPFGIALLALALYFRGPFGRRMLKGDISDRTLTRINEQLMEELDRPPPGGDFMAALERQAGTLPAECAAECEKAARIPNEIEPFFGAHVRLPPADGPEGATRALPKVVDISGYKWCLFPALKLTPPERPASEPTPCFLAAIWDGARWQAGGLALPGTEEKATEVLLLRRQIVEKAEEEIRRTLKESRRSIWS